MKIYLAKQRNYCLSTSTNLLVAKRALSILESSIKYTEVLFNTPINVPCNLK